VVSNLALDRLRSARHRRETYVGPWLPEPILTEGDAGDELELAESVSMAMLVVLESLSPLERAVFVLKEVFDFSYGEIGAAIGRSEATVRQAARRARGHVEARRPRFAADRATTRQVTERFHAAVMGSDINALMELLAPDVALWTDGGGKVRQAMRPVQGAAKVAAWFAGALRRPYEGVEAAEMTVRVADINGAAGVLISAGARLIGAVTVDLDADGRITVIRAVANPDKLADVAAGRRRDIGVHPQA
jgi:RNA polymerase sigma-70 factor (ECF subfamily)